MSAQQKYPNSMYVFSGGWKSHDEKCVFNSKHTGYCRDEMGRVHISHAQHLDLIAEKRAQKDKGHIDA